MVSSYLNWFQRISRDTKELCKISLHFSSISRHFYKISENKMEPNLIYLNFKEFLARISTELSEINQMEL